MTCLINRDLPDIRNQQYFSTISTMHANMVFARRKMQLSLIDQEVLIEKIYIWKQEDLSIEIFFRQKSTEAVNNDDKKDNIEEKEQEIKFKNEDSVNNDEKTEDDIEGEEQEIKFKNEDSVHPLLFLAVSVYNLVGRNLNKAHHIVFLDKTKKYVNNAVVILTYPPPQKTVRLLMLLYFFKGAKYYSAISIKNKLGNFGSEKLQMDPQIEKKTYYQ